MVLFGGVERCGCEVIWAIGPRCSHGQPRKTFMRSEGALYPMTKSRLLGVIRFLVFALGVCFSGPSMADAVLDDVRRTLAQPDRLPLIVEKRRAALAKYYGSDDAGLLWHENERSADLIAHMQSAADQGLRPEDYPFQILRETYETATRSQSQMDAAWLELLFTSHFLDFASDLRAGRVSPRVLYPDAYMPRNTIDAAEALDRLGSSDGIGGFIEIWQPQDDTYRRLKEHLARLRAVQTAGGFTYLEPGEELEAGQTSPKVPAVRQRLYEDGLLAAAVGEEQFDKRTAFAVAQAQQRYGKPISANLTSGLIRALNIPIDRRIEQLENAMERIRWIPNEYARLQLFINKGENRYLFLDGGRVVQEGRAYANCPDRNHTALATTIEAVTLYPTWQVPWDYLGKELLPRLRDNPDELTSEGYYLRRRGADVPLSALPWRQATPRTLKQLEDETILYLSGSGQNPLGRYSYRLRREQKLSLFDLADVPEGDVFCNPYLPKSAFGIVDGLDLLDRIVDPRLLPPRGVGQQLSRNETVTFPARGGLMAVVSHQSVWIQHQGIIQFGNDPYLEDARLTAALSGRPKP